jgi:hypothetical protein
MNEQAHGLTSRVGPIEIDWPRSIGYYSGLGATVALEFIEPPLAIFIAAIPFFKILNRPLASRPTRFVSQMLEGMAKPVGGDSSATIELTSPDIPKGQEEQRAEGLWRRVRSSMAAGYSSAMSEAPEPAMLPAGSSSSILQEARQTAERLHTRKH